MALKERLIKGSRSVSFVLVLPLPTVAGRGSSPAGCVQRCDKESQERPRPEKFKERLLSVDAVSKGSPWSSDALVNSVSHFPRRFELSRLRRCEVKVFCVNLSEIMIAPTIMFFVLTRAPISLHRARVTI